MRSTGDGVNAGEILQRLAGVNDMSLAVAVVEKQQPTEAAIWIAHQARQAFGLPSHIRRNELDGPGFARLQGSIRLHLQA